MALSGSHFKIGLGWILSKGQAQTFFSPITLNTKVEASKGKFFGNAIFLKYNTP